jgi:hypothetical protein
MGSRRNVAKDTREGQGGATDLRQARRERRRNRTREEILEAARTVLLANGVAAMTLEAVATEAGMSSRSALSVTSTVAPVSARIAGQRPVMPTTVVTRNTAFSPSATAMFWRMLRHGARDRSTMRGDVGRRGRAARGIRRLQRDIGAAAHGDADVGGGERRRVVDAVADLGDHKPSAEARRRSAACPRAGARLRRRCRACLPIASAVRSVVAGEHDRPDAERRRAKA